MIFASVSTRADNGQQGPGAASDEDVSSDNAAPKSKPQHSQQPSPQKRQEGKKAASVAMLLLVGVMVVGILLVSCTMLWGYRLRRIARTKQPARTEFDELWYLKSKAARTDEAPPAEPEKHSDPNDPP